MEKIVPKLPIVRSEVRAYVAYTEGRLEEASKNGKNTHQLNLDLTDELLDSIKDWSLDDQNAFLDVYKQETSAFMTHKSEEQIKSQQDKDKAEIEDVLTNYWIGVFAVVILVLIAVFAAKN